MTRERIVAIASRLFRQKGVNGVGVADLMAAADLTHGGFYRHFASKDELVADAIDRAVDEVVGRLEDDAARHGAAAAVAAYVDRYLSMTHVAARGEGCAIAAFASEAARGDPPVREAVARGAERIVAALARGIPGEPVQARRRAEAVFATLVGTLVLARAAASRTAAETVLAAGREAVDRHLGAAAR